MVGKQAHGIERRLPRLSGRQVTCERRKHDVGHMDRQLNAMGFRRIPLHKDGAIIHDGWYG